MTPNELRAGKIKTMSGAYSINAFEQQFPNSQNHVFVYSSPIPTLESSRDHYPTELLAKPNESEPFSELTKALHAEDVPLCCFPIHYESLALLPEVEALCFDSLLRLFYAVGLGLNAVVPIRPVQERDTNGSYRYFLSYELRHELVKAGVLPSVDMTLDLWQKPLQSMFNGLDFEREHSPLDYRGNLHASYANGLLLLQHFRDKLELLIPDGKMTITMLLTQWEKDRVSEFPALMAAKKFTFFSEEQYKILLNNFARGAFHHLLKKTNRLDKYEPQAILLHDQTIRRVQLEPVALKVNLNQERKGQVYELVPESQWKKAITSWGFVQDALEATSPITVLKRDPVKSALKIGFESPREWMFYFPKKTTVEIQRNCSKQVYRALITMAVSNKLAWIDVSSLPDNQKKAITEMVAQMKISIEVRTDKPAPQLAPVATTLPTAANQCREVDLAQTSTAMTSRCV